MGTVSEGLYLPDDINWKARANVKAWDMANREIPTELHAKKKDGPAISGVIFAVMMAVVLVGTYKLYF